MEKRYLRIAAAARIQLHPPEHQEEGEEQAEVRRWLGFFWSCGSSRDQDKSF